MRFLHGIIIVTSKDRKHAPASAFAVHFTAAPWYRGTTAVDTYPTRQPNKQTSRHGPVRAGSGACRWRWRGVPESAAAAAARRRHAAAAGTTRAANDDDGRGRTAGTAARPADAAAADATSDTAATDAADDAAANVRSAAAGGDAAAA